MENDITISRRNSTPQKLKQSQIDKIKTKFGRLSAKQQDMKSDLSKIITSIFEAYKKNDFKNDTKLNLLNQYLLLKNITDGNLGFVKMLIDKKEVLTDLINSTIDDLLNSEILNKSIIETIQKSISPSEVKTDINKILKDLIDEYVKQNKDLIKSQQIELVEDKSNKKSTENDHKSEDINDEENKEDIIEDEDNVQKTEEIKTDDDKLKEKWTKKQKLAILANNKITKSILNTAISMFRTQQTNIMYTVDSIANKPIVSKLKKVITESDIIKKIPKMTKPSDDTKKLSDVVSHSILLHARLLKRRKYKLTKRLKTLTDSLIYKNVRSGRKTTFGKALGVASSLFSVGSFIVGGVFGIGKFFVSSTLKLASGLLKFTTSIISKTWKHIAKPIIKRLVDIFMNPVGARMLGMLSAMVVIGFEKKFSKMIDVEKLYKAFKLSVGDFYTNTRLFFRNIQWEKLAKRFNKLTSNINGNHILDWLTDTLTSLTPGNITRFFIAYGAAKTISTAVSFIPFATKVKALSVVAFNPWVLATVGVGIAAYSIFSAIKEHNDRRKKNKEIDAQRQMENELGITSYKSGEQIYNRYATFNIGRQSRSVMSFSNDFVSHVKSFENKKQLSLDEKRKYRMIEAAEKSRKSRDAKVEQEKISRYVDEQKQKLDRELDKLTDKNKTSYMKYSDGISEIPIKYRQGKKINTTTNLNALGIEPKDYLKFRSMYAIICMQLLKRLASQEISIEEYENQVASLYDATQDNKLNAKIVNDNPVEFLKPSKNNPNEEKISASEFFGSDNVQHIQSIIRTTSSKQKQGIVEKNIKLGVNTVSTFAKSGGWHRQYLCFKLFMSHGKPIDYHAYTFPPTSPNSADVFLLEILRHEDVWNYINNAISNIDNSDEFHTKLKVFVNMMFHDKEFEKEFRLMVSSWLKPINNYEMLILKESWGGGRIKDNIVSYVDMNEQVLHGGGYYTDKKKLYKTVEYMGSLLNTKYTGHNGPQSGAKFNMQLGNDHIVYYASGDCEMGFKQNKSNIRFGGKPQDFILDVNSKNGKLNDTFYVKDKDDINNGCKIYIRLSEKSHIQYKFYDYNKGKAGIISEYKIVTTPDAPPIVQQFGDFIIPWIKIFLETYKKDMSIDGADYNFQNSGYSQSGLNQPYANLEKGFRKVAASIGDSLKTTSEKAQEIGNKVEQQLSEIRQNIDDIKEFYTGENSDFNKTHKLATETQENNFNTSTSNTNIKAIETEPKLTTDDHASIARKHQR